MLLICIFFYLARIYTFYIKHRWIDIEKYNFIVTSNTSIPLPQRFPKDSHVLQHWPLYFFFKNLVFERRQGFWLFKFGMNLDEQFEISAILKLLLLKIVFENNFSSLNYVRR